MTFGSLFTGAGMFDLGLERAGLECRWQCEIDPSARKVLEHHWPNVKRHQDVTKVRKRDLEPVNLVVGGFPCQDVSVAGRRAGLAGERSCLWWEFHRIIKLVRPAWVLIENVPGLLSSNGGRDLWAILKALGELRYGFAYRVLDGQFFGVPQRRRRVFIVGCLGGWRSAAEVLFERESSPWDSPPSREAGQRVAASLTRGTDSHGKGGYAGRRREDDSNIVNTLDAHMGMGGPDDNAAQAGHLVFDWQSGGDVRLNVSDKHTSALQANQVSAVYPCLRSNMHNNSDAGMEAQMFVTHALRSEGADASEDGTGRGTPLVACTLRSASSSPAAHGKQNGTDRETLVPVAFQTRIARNGRGQPKEITDALTSADGGTHADSKPHVALSSGVRRLTPRECERLQGLPDDWTLPAGSDSARYRLIGNGGVVNVLEWIGSRILSSAREG